MLSKRRTSYPRSSSIGIDVHPDETGAAGEEDGLGLGHAELLLVSLRRWRRASALRTAPLRATALGHGLDLVVGQIGVHGDGEVTREQVGRHRAAARSP